MNEQNPSINAFIDSVTEHAFRKHSPDLRDERSSGKSQPPSRSMGDSLQIVDKDNFRGHLRETLSNPETKYFIDESTGRMTFFNNDSSNRTMLIFNPAQFETDGHAGTLIRPAVRRQDLDFDNALAEATSNMDGKAPEIRSVADGAWIEHLDKYEVELANAPKRSLGAGDLVDDYTRARDFKAGLPYEPDVTNTKLNLPEAKGVLLGTGMVAVAGFGTLVMTGSPAQAGNAMAETAKPEYWDASMMALEGDNDGAFEEFVQVTPSVIGCGVGTFAGVLGGGGFGSLATGAAGCEVGSRYADDMAGPYVNRIIAEYRYPTAEREADLAAQQAITPDADTIALQTAQQDAEREERYAGFDQETGAKQIPGVDGYDNAALHASAQIDADILPPNVEMLKHRLGGELPENMLPKIPTGNPDLAISDDAQWMASTNGETNEAYTEASQLIERINDPYTDMHPVEYNQGHAYLTDPTTPDTAINLLESQYPDGMQKLRNEELEQLDQKAGEAVSELDRKEWIAQQNRMGDAYNSPAANDPNTPQTSQMVSGAR